VVGIAGLHLTYLSELKGLARLHDCMCQWIAKREGIQVGANRDGRCAKERITLRRRDAKCRRASDEGELTLKGYRLRRRRRRTRGGGS